MGTAIARVDDTAEGICVGGCIKCPHVRTEDIKRQGSSFNVYANGIRVQRKGGLTKVHSAHRGKLGIIMQGSGTVFANGIPVAKVGSRTSCFKCWQYGAINKGSPDVFVGG